MFHSREFELDMVSYLLKKPLFLKQHKSKLSGVKYQDKFINIVYKILIKQILNYDSVPAESELKKAVMEDMAANDKFNQLEIDITQEMVADLYQRNVTDLTGISITNYLVEDEAKKIASEISSLKGEDLLTKLRDFEHRLAKLSLLSPISDEDLGMNFFSDEGLDAAKHLLNEYNSMACIKTLYERWDTMLQGGLRKGELCVLLAPTGVGKTATLLNLAMNFLKTKQRVVYLVLDNIEGEMITRTVGCSMDKDISVEIDAETAIEDVRENLKDKYKDLFWYKHYNPRELTRSKIEKYLEKLKLHLIELDRANNVPEEECGVIDVLIIDYMDLMISESGASEFWISAEHLAQEIKALLKANNILGVTATQGGTDAMKAETIKLYMAQGAKSRFNCPDLIFSISQSDDEKKAFPARFRLGCLKARRARSNYEIPFLFHKEHQVIIEDPSIEGILCPRSEENAMQPRTNQDGSQVQKRNDYTAEISSLTNKFTNVGN